MDTTRSVSSNHSLVILESHTGIRSFLRHLVTDIPGLVVAGEAADCTSARQLLEQTPGAIIVADPLLRPFGAFDLIEPLPKHAPEPRVVIYSHDNPAAAVIDQSLRLRASIVSGEDAVEEIQSAIETARDGDWYYSTSIQEQLIRTETGELQVELSEKLRTLTPQRLAVLLLMAWGYSVKEAARELKKSEKSVDSQLDRLRRGLGIRNRVDLSMLCLREGLINGYVESFVTRCPTCDVEIHLGIAQWIQSRRRLLEVSCRKCSSSWFCSQDQIQRQPLDGSLEKDASTGSATIGAPHFEKAERRV